jgi:hypothetical protein
MRPIHVLLGLSAALLPAAAAVETGATVAVVFDQPIDPATLTSATFRVTRDGVPLPAALSRGPATSA